MLEALWSAQFRTNEGFDGAGVVIFETNRIFGGDSSYYYLGDYRFDAKTDLLSANVKVTHYAGPRNNVFGPLDRVTLTLAGKLTDGTLVVAGTAAEAPGKEIVVRLTRIASLP